jgi:hypothetical protein
MAILVELESLNTKSRLVTPSYLDEAGEPSLVSSELPMPTADISALRTFEGRTFSIGATRSFDNKLPAGQSLDLAVAWAEDVVPRIVISGITGGDAMGYLYEGATVSGGTAVTAINLRRDSTRTSQSAALIQPTVSSLGTLLLEQVLIGGAGKKAGGGGSISSRIYLKPLTTYLFRITNKDSNNTAHATEIILEWYE